MKHDLSPRAQVAALKAAGNTQRLSASIIGKPLSFVKRWWHREDLLDHYGGGKRLVVTRQLIERIKNRAYLKNHQSTRVIARAMHVSHSTVARAVHLLAFKPYHHIKKLILSEKKKQLRVAWAKKFKNQNWGKVLFTDEKIVRCVSHPNSKNDIVWALPGDVIPPAPNDRHSSKMNVSAAVWSNGRSEIFVFSENLASPLYIKILRDTIIKEGGKIPGGGWELYLDNDPKHTSKLTKAFLSEKHIRTIKPPPSSPELNIIENVWSMLDNQLKQMGNSTASTLRSNIKRAWKKIPQSAIQNMVLSMPRRLKLIIDGGGAAIKY